MTPLIKPPLISILEQLGINLVFPVDRVIYKYTSLKIAMEIIKSNSLLFSPPIEFNDPFDLTNTLIDSSFNKIILKKWMERFDHLRGSHKKKLIKDSLSDPQKVKKIFNETLEKFKRTSGIICFSKSFTKTLMWSHYADKHAGICLGFNINPIGMKEFTLLEVNYADNIKPLNFFLNKPEVFMYWIYTKSNVWSYEEEVRALYSSRNGLIKFNKQCLKEVHFGLRTSLQQRKEFNDNLNKLNYDVKKMTFMTMNSKNFDLKVNSYT